MDDLSKWIAIPPFYEQRLNDAISVQGIRTPDGDRILIIQRLQDGGVVWLKSFTPNEALKLAEMLDQACLLAG